MSAVGVVRVAAYALQICRSAEVGLVAARPREAVTAARQRERIGSGIRIGFGVGVRLSTGFGIGDRVGVPLRR